MQRIIDISFFIFFPFHEDYCGLARFDYYTKPEHSSQHGQKRKSRISRPFLGFNYVSTFVFGTCTFAAGTFTAGTFATCAFAACAFTACAFTACAFTAGRGLDIRNEL